MAKFEKGHKKLGGRKEGAANKSSRIIQEAFASVLTPEIAQGLVRTAIAHMAKGKPGCFDSLAKYGLVQMARGVELSGQVNGSVTIKLVPFDAGNNG